MANYVVSYSSKFKSASCTSLVAARQDVVERLFGGRVNAVATIKKDGKIVERIYPNRIPDDEDIVMPVFVAVDVASGRMRASLRTRASSTESKSGRWNIVNSTSNSMSFMFSHQYLRHHVTSPARGYGRTYPLVGINPLEAVVAV